MMFRVWISSLLVLLSLVTLAAPSQAGTTPGPKAPPKLGLPNPTVMVIGAPSAHSQAVSVSVKSPASMATAPVKSKPTSGVVSLLIESFNTRTNFEALEKNLNH